MTNRRCLLLLLVCCALGLAVPTVVGMTYSERLSSHEGFYLVRVTDTAEVPVRRPRRSVLVVFDGLGYAEARDMRSLSRLQALGQCWRTDVGPLSLSRPVYAVLSTGLEQDRSGARGNDDVRPLAAESVWELARAAGMTVTGVSELPWWHELFPGGFDAYEVAERASNFFERAAPAQLQLIHPLYVDEAGHADGAASRAYGEAVARADGELSAFIDTLDLSQDLIVVTADHGHAPRGGHGGRQDNIAHVRTCFAGLGVRHLAAEGPLRATTVGPALALLLGLPFPAHMRAGDDDLDALWDIADPAALPDTYMHERRGDVDRFRGANAAQLREWLPASAGSWDRFYEAHRRRQWLVALPVLALLPATLGLLVWLQRRRARVTGRRGALFGVGFVVMTFVGVYALQVALRGSFDLSSIADREDFLGFTTALSVFSIAAAIALHLHLRRDPRALLLDWTALSVVGTLLSLGHPLALGWRLGYPVPAPELFFFPYFAAIFLGTLNGVGLLLCLAGAVLERSRRPARSSHANLLAHINHTDNGIYIKAGVLPGLERRR